MNKLYALGALIVALVAVPLLSYGTLSPCGMLRKELKLKMLENLQANKSGWEALGSAVGLGLGSNIVDGMVDALSPMQCLRGVARMKFSGESPFGEQSPFADVPSTRKETTMHEVLPGWQVSTDKSAMDDSTTVTLTLYADKPVQGWLKKRRAFTCLRCKERETNLFVIARMQVQTDTGDYDRSSVRLRFDQEKARSEKFLKIH